MGFIKPQNMVEHPR